MSAMIYVHFTLFQPELQVTIVIFFYYYYYFADCRLFAGDLSIKMALANIITTSLAN